MDTLSVSEDTASKILKPDAFHGKPGFPSWEVTNLGANIRRLKQRVEQAKRLGEAEHQEATGKHGKFEDSPEDNRVRVFFDAKPSADTIHKLKSNGFRWTPSLGAWQAYRNFRSTRFAKEFAGVDEE